jgi:cytidyltransferase-like protein
VTTVFVSGIFNVLHPGHLRLLRFAKESGSRVLVAVLSDRLAGNAVHVPEMLRLEGVKSNSWVDDAFVVDEPVIQVIGCLQPDIVVKGMESLSSLRLSCCKRSSTRLHCVPSIARRIT